MFFFQFGFLFIHLGGRCTQLAVAWWSLRMADSAAVFATMLAFSGGVELVSRLLLGFVGDRYDKCRVVVLCNLASATACAALAMLAFSGHYHSGIVALLMSAMAVASGIRDPLQSSIIPAMVPAAEVPAAFGTKGMLYSVALLLGPLIAGFLIAYVGEAVTLMVDLLGMALGSALIWRAFARIDRHVAAMKPDRTPGKINPLFGLRMVLRVKAEFYMAVFAMGINFTLYPFFSLLLPYYIQQGTHFSASVLGMLEAAFAVGIFCASARIVKYSNALIGRDRSVPFGFGLLAINMSAVYFSDLVGVLLVAFFGGGVGLMLININTSCVRALATPASHLNQMTSAVSFLSTAINPVGSLVAGGLVVALGFEMTLAVLVAMTSVSALALPLITEIRRFLRTPDSELRGSYLVAYPEAFR